MKCSSWAIVAVVLAGFTAAPVLATWSIVVVDTHTREVGVGTVTCLQQFDLVSIVPVIAVEQGAGACQSAGDFEGVRRPFIYNGLRAGLPVNTIFAQLAPIPGHQNRQYGIVNVRGEALTFTGNLCSPWAGGFTFRDGARVVAIQGNLLNGECVVQAARGAFLATPGDLPAKLMAAMEAAAEAGGDARCSCFGASECTCPQVAFEKSGHIGGILLARRGDRDLGCDAGGCSRDRYFMRLDVAFQTFADPDPVVQMRGAFDAWREELRGIPDAVASDVEFLPVAPAPGERPRTRMRITLRDWSGATDPVAQRRVRVSHTRESAGRSGIGAVAALGGGVYEVMLSQGSRPGVDRFDVTVDVGRDRPVILMPPPSMVSGAATPNPGGIRAGAASRESLSPARP